MDRAEERETREEEERSWLAVRFPDPSAAETSLAWLPERVGTTWGPGLSKSLCRSTSTAADSLMTLFNTLYTVASRRVLSATTSLVSVPHLCVPLQKREPPAQRGEGPQPPRRRPMAAAATADLERRVMAAVKASAARGDPPLLQATEAARCAREASVSGGLALAPALVANLCFAHNTGAMWKLLDQAMASRLVCPLHTLALLTQRVVPNRREQPEAYRLYLELLGRYTVAPSVYPVSAETKAMLAESIDDAMQLSQRYGSQHLDFGHTVTLFIFGLIKILIDCILEDCESPSNSVDEHCDTYTENMDTDSNESLLDLGDGHGEHLRRNNILMSIEVVERIAANKMVGVFLRLVYCNTPEYFNNLLQRLHLMGTLKSKIVLPSLVDSLTKNIQKIISPGHQLGRCRLLGVLVSSQHCSSATFNIFRPRKGSYWILLDMLMEHAMDGRQLHAVSSIEFFTELSKTLKVLNRATWQETFQALWISALRLVQRGSDTLEGPFPHLDSRLCMLLAVIPLSIATIVKEEADKMEGGMASIIKGELLYSLQVLGQFFSLLSPPPATVHLANTAARKAALVLSNIKAGNVNLHYSNKDSSFIKADGNMRHLIVEACIARNLIDTSAYLWPGYVVPVKESSPVRESPWSTLMEGYPLIELKDALMVTPASSVAELEKLYSFAVLGSEEEKLAASKILCGASLLRGWNIQEHVVQMVLKLLSTFLPSDSGSDDKYVQYMPVLHALISGISSIDAVHILSMYGLVPELAAMLMPLCEIFGSLLPPSDRRTCNLEEASIYSVFSCAFLSLLQLWKFHRPPVENALSRRGVSIWSELRLDFLLLLRNSGSALKNLSNLSGTSIFLLDPSFHEPININSFPKLRAWYLQNLACIASTLSNASNRTSVLRVADMLLKIICRKISKGGGLSLNLQSTLNSSMSSSPVGVQEDIFQWPNVPAWEVLEAVPFVLESVLTACAYGKLSSRDLITGYMSD